MAATREARKREMIANLDNDVYIKALVDEAYATIFTGSTTNTVAQKKVKRIFEADGCHIGASAKHDTWEDKNGSFESVDAFLSSDNSAGSVRDQLAIYTLFLMFDTRLRYETSATERERDAWTTYREGVHPECRPPPSSSVTDSQSLTAALLATREPPFSPSRNALEVQSSRYDCAPAARAFPSKA